MRLIRAVCPSCGANLDFDIDSRQAYCTFCGAKMFVDDETIHVHHENGEQFGYEFEKGRQRAIEEAEQQKRESERPTRHTTETDGQKPREASASTEAAKAHAPGAVVTDAGSQDDERARIRKGIFGLLRFLFWMLMFLFFPLVICYTVLDGYTPNNWVLGTLLTVALFAVVRVWRRKSG